MTMFVSSPSLYTRPLMPLNYSANTLIFKVEVFTRKLDGENLSATERHDILDEIALLTAKVPDMLRVRATGRAEIFAATLPRAANILAEARDRVFKNVSPVILSQEHRMNLLQCFTLWPGVGWYPPWPPVSAVRPREVLLHKDARHLKNMIKEMAEQGIERQRLYEPGGAVYEAVLHLSGGDVNSMRWSRDAPIAARSLFNIIGPVNVSPENPLFLQALFVVEKSATKAPLANVPAISPPYRASLPTTASQKRIRLQVYSRHRPKPSTLTAIPTIWDNATRNTLDTLPGETERPTTGTDHGETGCIGVNAPQLQSSSGEPVVDNLMVEEGNGPSAKRRRLDATASSTPTKRCRPPPHVVPALPKSTHDAIARPGHLEAEEMQRQTALLKRFTASVSRCIPSGLSPLAISTDCLDKYRDDALSLSHEMDKATQHRQRLVGELIQAREELERLERRSTKRRLEAQRCQEDWDALNRVDAGGTRDAVDDGDSDAEDRAASQLMRKMLLDAARGSLEHANIQAQRWEEESGTALAGVQDLEKEVEEVDMKMLACKKKETLAKHSVDLSNAREAAKIKYKEAGTRLGFVVELHEVCETSSP